MSGTKEMFVIHLFENEYAPRAVYAGRWAFLTGVDSCQSLELVSINLVSI